MISDLGEMARYWMKAYSSKESLCVGELDGMKPLVLVSGANADMIAQPKNIPIDLTDSSAHIAALLTYPCDGVYTVVLWLTPEGTPQCWAHCLPTNETIMSFRANPETFGSVHEAIHDFDSYPIEEGETHSRNVAIQAMRSGGERMSFWFEVFRPGTLVGVARSGSAGLEQ